MVGDSANDFMKYIDAGVPVEVIEDKFTTINNIDLLNEMIEKKGYTKAKLINEVEPDNDNFYKYLNGTRRMKRNTLIKILICLGINEDEIQETLKEFEFSPLYPKIKRDYIILLGLKMDLTISEINAKLAENGEYLL